MGCVCMSNITMMELSRELDEQFDRLVNECRVSGEINQELYTEYDVKRGLRDANGKGVLTGLTEISDVLSYKSVDGICRRVQKGMGLSGSTSGNGGLCWKHRKYRIRN